MTPREFEQAVEFFVGQLLFALEDTVEHMCWAGECEIVLGRVEPAERIMSQVGRVRRTDLTQVARGILRPDRMSLAVIGPVKKKVSHQMKQILGDAS